MFEVFERPLVVLKITQITQIICKWFSTARLDCWRIYWKGPFSGFCLGFVLFQRFNPNSCCPESQCPSENRRFLLLVKSLNPKSLVCFVSIFRGKLQFHADTWRKEWFLAFSQEAQRHPRGLASQGLPLQFCLYGDVLKWDDKMNHPFSFRFPIHQPAIGVPTFIPMYMYIYIHIYPCMYTSVVSSIHTWSYA